MDEYLHYTRQSKKSLNPGVSQDADKDINILSSKAEFSNDFLPNTLLRKLNFELLNGSLNVNVSLLTSLLSNRDSFPA